MPPGSTVVTVPAVASASSTSKRRRPTVSAAALALAALQQPIGSEAATQLALAAGRAVLTIPGGCQPRGRRHGAAVAPAALSVAAARMEPQVAAALAMAGAARLPPRFRRQRAVQVCSPRSRKQPPLCHDTTYRVVKQLLPPRPDVHDTSAEAQNVGHGIGSSGSMTNLGRAALSPRTFETRLRQSAPILRNLQQVSAVSAFWARRVECDGWPAAHAYLYEEPGSCAELQQRYAASMQRLLVQDWVCCNLPTAPVAAPTVTSRTDLAEGIVGRIVAFAAS